MIYILNINDIHVKTIRPNHLIEKNTYLAVQRSNPSPLRVYVFGPTVCCFSGACMMKGDCRTASSSTPSAKWSRSGDPVMSSSEIHYTAGKQRMGKKDLCPFRKEVSLLTHQNFHFSNNVSIKITGNKLY